MTVVVEDEIVRRLTPVVQEANNALRTDVSYLFPIAEVGRTIKAKRAARQKKSLKVSKQDG